MRNWAGNLTFTPEQLHRPTSVDDVCALVARAERIHALGTGHSFSPVADGPGELLTVADLPRVVVIDPAQSTVTVSAGVRWGELAPLVHSAGFALAAMGSLPHISVAGSIATGTHGSGDNTRCLGAAVVGLDLVTATGELRHLSQGDAGFDGSVVALGCLGIVTSVTLDLVPSYELRQRVYEGLAWDDALGQFDAIMASGYSVSMFTRWTPGGVDQVWVKQLCSARDAVDWSGATLADGPRHPVPGMDPIHTTQQGSPGSWFERLPHFRLDFAPSSGAELQTEYLLPREHALPAINALRAIGDRITPVLQIGELRTVAADELWLSPCYGRDSVALHFTWIADLAAVRPALHAVEEQLAPFDPRPHWGKVFGYDGPTVAAQYPRLPEFRALVQALDPAGKFGNPFVDCYLGAEPGFPR